MAQSTHVYTCYVFTCQMITCHMFSIMGLPKVAVKRILPSEGRAGPEQALSRMA